MIKHEKENKILDLKEFFEVLSIKVSEELYQKVDNNFTLFIYSQSEGNRLGFAVKINDRKTVESLLKSQEGTMEQDFDSFFKLMGKEGPASFSYFRSASNVAGYKGISFRYQTLTNYDLAICYLITDQHLIFTSSWKSMVDIIDKLDL